VIDKLGYKRKLVEVDNAILANAAFLDQIVANPEIFENNPGEEGDEGEGEDGIGESLDGPRVESEGLPANR
jgi:carnosine N-methyltransferase